MHLYAFGSVCRGDITKESDIDLLALVDGYDDRLDPAVYSIYSYAKVKQMWLQGSPFAWHLHIESRLLFTSDGSDFIQFLGRPANYLNYFNDCKKFHHAFSEARTSLSRCSSTRVFDLSTIFLSIRNIATCFALGVLNLPLFKRGAALHLPNEFALPLSAQSYRTLERARILCTRSSGADLTSDDIEAVILECDQVLQWMEVLLEKAKEHGRVQ